MKKPITTEEFSSILAETLSIVFQSSRKMTPAELGKILSDKFSINRHNVKSIIQKLIRREELIYTYQYGLTFLERSFSKPARISSKVILTPVNRPYLPTPNEVVIKIMDGASFGAGDHPTTRLAIKSIEHALTHSDLSKHPKSVCLDIGTGSGVLAITAIQLGINTGLGIDIDPNAISEAKNNVSLNHLNHRITIRNVPVELLTEPYFLIMANLRYPTLIQLSSDIFRLLENDGFFVMSGFRMDELPAIIDEYTYRGFDSVWIEEEKGWGSITITKKPVKP